MNTSINMAPAKYYVRYHFYIPVALTNDLGQAVERYEYDAYGKCYVLEPNFAPDPDGKSDVNNPFLFTGREMDTLDNGSLKIMNYRHRYYDTYTGRFSTHDPLGITPNPQQLNSFAVISQYKDGINLYEYALSNPVFFIDLFGLTSSTCGPFCDCEPHLFDEEEITCSYPWGTWNPALAALWFLIGKGQPVIFCPQCPLSLRIANDPHFINSTLRQTFQWLEEKAANRAAEIKPNSCEAVQIVGYGAPYQFGHDWFLENTIGSGGGDPPGPWSILTYNAKCCLKKPCCNEGNVEVDIQCKVLFNIADKYSLDFYPDFTLGTPFWSYVYFYKDFGPKDISVSCD